MKFAIFSDLHYDAIPDGDKRIEEIITCAKKAKVDFMIDLGDLCYPLNENKRLLENINSSELPCYFTIGNHNTDSYTIDEVLDFFNMERSYYSFIVENIKFIILDANFINKKTNVIPYCKRNYDKSNDEYPYIPNEEIDWLKKELDDNDKYYIIISHQSLSNDFQKRGISNRKEIRAILEERNLKGRKLKNLILYKEALHVIVNIDNEMNVSINGINGNYQRHSPKDIGLTDTWNGVSIEAKTLSKYIKMER